MMRTWSMIVVAGFLVACGDDGGSDPQGFSGPGVSIDIGWQASTLPIEAVWDIELRAGENVTLQGRYAQSSYGAPGGLLVVLPCTAGQDNTVSVWLVGTYDAIQNIEAAGDFNTAIAAPRTSHPNPTWDDVDGDGVRGAGDVLTPVERDFPCVENQDVFVDIDVTLDGA